MSQLELACCVSQLELACCLWSDCAACGVYLGHNHGALAVVCNHVCNMYARRFLHVSVYVLYMYIYTYFDLSAWNRLSIYIHVGEQVGSNHSLPRTPGGNVLMMPQRAASFRYDVMCMCICMCMWVDVNVCMCTYTYMHIYI